MSIPFWQPSVLTAQAEPVPIPVLKGPPANETQVSLVRMQSSRLDANSARDSPIRSA